MTSAAGMLDPTLLTRLDGTRRDDTAEAPPPEPLPLPALSPLLLLCAAMSAAACPAQADAAAERFGGAGTLRLRVAGACNAFIMALGSRRARR